jgi:thiamine-phosphate pyrophosphorylase
LKNINAPLSGLYAISDDILTPRKSVLTQAEAVLRGGAKLFQLREKFSSDKELAPLVESLRRLCDFYGAKLIINDRINLAKNADGVHIGASDRALCEARSALGDDAIIGVSCYGDLNRAIAAQNGGASYVSFGACFKSATKPNAPIIDRAVFGEAKKILRLPVCAIGGINAQNAASLIGQGVDMIAVVSDLWRSNNPQKQAEAFIALGL